MFSLIAPNAKNQREVANSKVFNTAFTPQEIKKIKEEWQPLIELQLRAIENDPGYRPENYPSMDTSTLISRILRTFETH